MVPSSRNTKQVRTCPYVGLVPFTAEDADYFAGREQEAKVVFSNLCAAPLTVFFGASGVGKSSLLQAGLIPLVRQSRACGTIVYFHRWQSPNFYVELKSACIRAAKQNQPDVAADPKQPLDELLSGLAHALRRPIFVVLDQFEDYLLFRAESPAGKQFEPELASAINDESTPAHFLIGIREDALSKLDRLDMRIPNLLGNTLRLRPVSREGAEAALRAPLAKYNESNRKGLPPIAIDDDLVNEVLSNTSTDKARFSDVGDGAGRSTPPGKPAAIELGFLQLVMTRLWETELSQGSNALRRNTLVNKLGGTAAVVRTHLDRLMRAFSDSEQRVCARIFHVLVTSSGNKITYTAPELVEHSGLALEELTRLLDKLTQVGILREVACVESADEPEENQERRFEIQHDRLASAVLDWRRRFVIERQIEREHAELKRRLLRWGGAVVFCSVAAVGLAFFSYRARENASALREMQALVIAPRLLDAASAARTKAAAAGVTPKGMLGGANLDEDLARRLVVQASEIYRTQIPRYLDENVKARIETPLSLPGPAWYLGLQNVSTMAFSAEGSMIAIGTDDGRVAVVPRDPEREPMYAPSQTGGFLALGFRSPGEPIAVGRGSPEGHVHAVEPLVATEATGDARRSLQLSRFDVDARPGNNVVFLDNDARNVLAFGSDGKLRIQSLLTGKDVWVSTTPDGEVSAAHLVSSGPEVRLGYATIAGQLKTVSIAGSKTDTTDRRVHAMGRTLVALASNSSQFAFATASGHDVSWWPRVAATTAVSLVSTSEQPGAVRKLAVSSDAKRVAALREDGLVSVWNVEATPKVVFEYRFAFPQFEAAFSPDLSHIAVFANEGLFLYELQMPASRPSQSQAAAALHADEYLMAVGDLAEGDLVRSLRAGVAASASGKLTDAIGAFKSALGFPGVRFDPRNEALRGRMLAIRRQLASEALNGKDVAELERILAVEEQKSGADAPALKNLEHLVDPVIAQAYLARAVQRLVDPKDIESKDPEFRTYLQVYSDLSKAEQLNPAAAVPAVYWNNLCWYGSLVGYAKKLVAAGERAVQLAPTDANVRDTRGIARALSGDTAGALSDFRFLLQDANIRTQLLPAAVAERKKWASELSSGQNPFTKDVLQKLRSE